MQLANLSESLATTKTIRTTGRVLDKFNRIVTFDIDRILGSALSKWIEQSGVRTYVFPSIANRERQMNNTFLRRWLFKICSKAGIQGTHVYIHGLRHTSATALYKAGNKVEDIAAFLGHRSAVTTQIYIDRVIARPQDRMLIPWLPQDDMAGLHPGNYEKLR